MYPFLRQKTSSNALPLLLLQYAPLFMYLFAIRAHTSFPLIRGQSIPKYGRYERINRFTGFCLFSTGNCNWIFNRAASRSVAGDSASSGFRTPLKLKGMPLAKGTRYARGLPLKQAMLLTFFRLYCSRSPASCPLPHCIQYSFSHI